MPEIAEAFAKIVTHHRKKKKWTRLELAARAGLHETYIGLLERGKRNPTLNTAEAIAKALKIPLKNLIKESSEKK